MADYRIAWAAQRDLQRIWDYTVEEWSVNQAEKYIDGLLACFSAVAKGRTKGKPVNHIRRGYKRAIYKRHIVFFSNRLRSGD